MQIDPLKLKKAKMRGRQRGNSRFLRRRNERRVIKKCPKCMKEIPVACKTCPKCKSSVRPVKEKPEQGEEEVVLRRTERVRREQPKFFHSLELTSGLKRGTKRKQSTSRESVNGKPSNSSNTEPSTSKVEPDQDNLKPEIEDYKPDRSSIMRPTTLEVDSPTKRRRGRPKSVTNQDSDKDKTPSEEDWYGHLPPEKFLQYKIILAEINRKITTQAFKPDG